MVCTGIVIGYFGDVVDNIDTVLVYIGNVDDNIGIAIVYTGSVADNIDTVKTGVCNFFGCTKPLAGCEYADLYIA